MKTKLLKKLKKKYDWYFNKDGFPVLINHYTKTVVIYDYEFCCNRLHYSHEQAKEMVKVPLQEWALRHFKKDILTVWGWRFDRSVYKKAILKLNIIKNGNSKK